MDKRQTQGIALILFGILLCLGSYEINETFFYSISNIPFGLLGVLSGIVGLIWVFTDDRRN